MWFEEIIGRLSKGSGSFIPFGRAHMSVSLFHLLKCIDFYVALFPNSVRPCSTYLETTSWMALSYSARWGVLLWVRKGPLMWQILMWCKMVPTTFLVGDPSHLFLGIIYSLNVHNFTLCEIWICLRWTFPYFRDRFSIQHYYLTNELTSNFIIPCFSVYPTS